MKWVLSLWICHTCLRKRNNTVVFVYVCMQVSHRQYVFLMQLQRSIKALQQTLQQDLEQSGSKKDRKDPSQRSTDHQPFTACLALLLKSAEVSLLLKPVSQPEGSGSPLGSELSPSESRGTLEPGSDAGEGGEKSRRGSEGVGSGCEGGAAKSVCNTVDQLLCDEGSGGPAPLVPTAPSATCAELNHKGLLDDRTTNKNSGKWSSEEGGEVGVDGLAGGEEVGAEKTLTGESLLDPLSSKDWNDKDTAASGKMPQSISRYLFLYYYYYTIITQLLH